MHVVFVPSEVCIVPAILLRESISAGRIFIRNVIRSWKNGFEMKPDNQKLESP